MIRDFVLASAKSLLFQIGCRGDEARYFALKGSLVRAAARRGLYERRYLALLPSLVSPGSVAVDVGAHFGAYTHALANVVGPTGRVVAFEPLPPVAQQLTRSCAGRRNVIIFEEAVSDRAADSLELQMPAIGWNVPEPALARTSGTVAGPAHTTFRVRARPLDHHASLVAEVTFIKVDIEGHELPFLAGARQIIESSRPVLQVESAGLMVRRDAALAWLEARDYVIITFRGRRLHRAGLEERLSLNVYLVPAERVSVLPAFREVRS